MHCIIWFSHRPVFELSAVDRKISVSGCGNCSFVVFLLLHSVQVLHFCRCLLKVKFYTVLTDRMFIQIKDTDSEVMITPFANLRLSDLALLNFSYSTSRCKHSCWNCVNTEIANRVENLKLWFMVILIRKMTPKLWLQTTDNSNNGVSSWCNDN